jgi:hypothetical protein
MCSPDHAGQLAVPIVNEDCRKNDCRKKRKSKIIQQLLDALACRELIERGLIEFTSQQSRQSLMHKVQPQRDNCAGLWLVVLISMHSLFWCVGLMGVIPLFGLGM